MEDPLDKTNGNSPLKYLWEVKKTKQCNTDQKEGITLILRK